MTRSIQSCERTEIGDRPQQASPESLARQVELADKIELTEAGIAGRAQHDPDAFAEAAVNAITPRFGKAWWEGFNKALATASRRRNRRRGIPGSQSSRRR